MLTSLSTSSTGASERLTVYNCSSVPLVAQLVYEALIRRERRRARQVSSALSDPAQQAPEAVAPHIDIGRRGERLAYWYLRRTGYTVVARNLRGRGGAGELDLVAWEGPVLAFVEIKTRTSTEAGPPEPAVSFGQRRRIAAAALTYIRGLKQKDVNYRFDIVSVTWDYTYGYQLRLIRDAFRVSFPVRK
jgi:putative endonuclease